MFRKKERLQPYTTLLSQPSAPRDFPCLREAGHRPRCCCCSPHLNLTMPPPRRLRASGASACALALFSGCDSAAAVDSVRPAAAPAFVVSSSTSFNDAASSASSSGRAVPLPSAAAALTPSVLSPSRITGSTYRSTERWGPSRQLLFTSSPTRACSRPAMGGWGACLSWSSSFATTHDGSNMSKLVSAARPGVLVACTLL